MSFLLPLCEEIPPESLPASDTISSPKCDMPASEPFISKETVERTPNCEFWLKIYHFRSFWKSLSSTKLTYTPTLSTIYTLTPYQIEVSLNADVSKNTLPFWSQSINNFSGYDISQSVDWECPSLFPHYLLTAVKTRHSPDWISRTNDLLCHSRPKSDVIRCSGDCSLDVENIFLGKRY